MGLEQLLPALLGGASALFGGGTDASLSPQQQWAVQRLKAFLQQQHKFARSPTLSTTQEQQGLANESALLSQAQRRNMEGLFGNLSAVDLGNPNVADLRRDVSLGNSAQQGALYANAAQQGLQRRDAARQSLPAYVQGVAGIAANPVNPAQSGGMESLLPLLFQFGQQWGQRGTSSRGMTNGFGPGNGGTPGGTGFEPAQSDPTMPMGGTTLGAGQQPFSGQGGWEQWGSWPKQG